MILCVFRLLSLAILGLPLVVHLAATSAHTEEPSATYFWAYRYSGSRLPLDRIDLDIIAVRHANGTLSDPLRHARENGADHLVLKILEHENGTSRTAAKYRPTWDGHDAYLSGRFSITSATTSKHYLAQDLEFDPESCGAVARITPNLMDGGAGFINFRRALYDMFRTKMGLGQADGMFDGIASQSPSRPLELTFSEYRRGLRLLDTLIAAKKEHENSWYYKAMLDNPPEKYRQYYPVSCIIFDDIDGDGRLDAFSNIYLDGNGYEINVPIMVSGRGRTYQRMFFFSYRMQKELFSPGTFDPGVLFPLAAYDFTGDGKKDILFRRSYFFGDSSDYAIADPKELFDASSFPMLYISSSHNMGDTCIATE